MQIQVNTDHNISGREALADQVKNDVQHALAHFAGHITRVEVHLTDENSDKKSGSDDMRCVMEARLEHHQPLAVSHRDATRHLAVGGSLDQLTRLVKKTIEKIRDQSRRRTDPVPPGV